MSGSGQFTPHLIFGVTAILSTFVAQNLELVKRQAANFVGYTYSDSEWLTLTCFPGYTYSETKSFGLNNPGYGDCCTTTLKTCYMWTTCTLGTLYGAAGSIPCGLGSSCVSGIVASSEGAELDGDLFLGCETIGDWIAYRTPPIAAPSITSVLITTDQIPSTTSPQISPSIPPIASPSPSNPASSPPTNSTTGVPSKSNVSGAAIAGAVVGPICGVALLLGLVFLFLRKRQSKPPAAEVSSNHQPPPPGPIAPFGDYMAGKPELSAINRPNSYRPVSIAPAYPGTENAWTTVAMPSPTMSHGTDVGAHSPIYIGQQLGAQVQPEIQSQQVPVRKPVMAEFGANPPVRGMPPELPESMRHFENTV